MHDPYKSACVHSTHEKLRIIRKLVKELESQLKSSVDEEVGKSFIATSVLHHYIQKQWQADCIRALDSQINKDS